MSQIEYSLRNVTLTQGKSFEPQLHVNVDFRFTKSNPQDGEYLQLVNTKCRLDVKSNDSDLFEAGISEQTGNVSLWAGNSTVVSFIIRLSSYVFKRIEELRAGDNLWFKCTITACSSIVRYDNGAEKFEVQNPQQRGVDTWKYPKSEWIENLNTTDFNKIELIEIPKIDFPKISLTENVTKFLDAANKAINEGRYGDVLKECRNAVDSVTGGLEEWAKNIPLTDEGQKITKNSEKNELYLSKLLNDKEKAARLNKIISSLHYYLSLNPHEAEYKGMQFTMYDAKFVMYTVVSLAHSILKHIENNSNT